METTHRNTSNLRDRSDFPDIACRYYNYMCIVGFDYSVSFCSYEVNFFVSEKETGGITRTYSITIRKVSQNFSCFSIIAVFMFPLELTISGFFCWFVAKVQKKSVDE